MITEINTTYSPNARFSTAVALTEDEMRARAPSIFATEAHESRSPRFRPIPTIEILRGLAKEGFVPVAVRQATSREPGKEPFTKHLVRLRNLDKRPSVGDTTVEALLKNANDGTARYRLNASLYRVTCDNSMVVHSQTIDEVAIGHVGNVQDKVIEGTFRVLTEAEKALVAPEQWAQLKLKSDEAKAFAKAAHVLRFADEDALGARAIDADQLLIPRRAEDTDGNLWTTFNVVQENALKGGLTGRAVDAQARMRQVTTRPIKGIDQDIRLNQALWVLAEEMANLKKAA